MWDVRNSQSLKNFETICNRQKIYKWFVNNAGIRQRKIFSNYKKKLRNFDINFFQFSNIHKCMLNTSRNKISSSVVNIGSIVGETGFKELCYSSTKGAIKALLNALH